MNLKVLQVLDKLDIGGAEMVSVNLAILLKNAGVQVDFLCILNSGKLDLELMDNGVNVIYLNRKNKFNPLKIIEMRCILQKYSIIHVHSRHVLRYVGLTLLFPNYLRKYKIIFHDHFGNIKNDRSISYFTKKIVQNCSAYIGVSQELVKWASHNALNSNLYLVENIIRKINKEKIIITKSQIIAVGNFRKAKNYDFLLDLAIMLPVETSIDVYGNIVDKDYYKHIQKRIERENLLKKIRLIHSEKNISGVLNNYKMAIHCADSETGPLVAIEYMANKTPFICFNTGEVALKMKQDNFNNVLETFEIASWLSKINVILTDQKYNKELGDNLYKHYCKNYSEKEYLEKCLKIYKSVAI